MNDTYAESQNSMMRIKTNMAHILPALIPNNFDHLKEEMALVKDFVSRVQIDVADGSYAPNTTWPYLHKVDTIFEKIKAQDEGMPFWEDVDFEVDLLISNPERVLLDWIAAGASGFIVHIESTRAHADCVEMIREADVELGWGISPKTDLEELFDLIDTLEMPDFIQVMGSDKIGYHGVELDPHVPVIVSEIRERYPDLPIAVDIGVNEDTAPKLVAAGVTKLIAGSAILDAEDIPRTIAAFQNLE